MLKDKYIDSLDISDCPNLSIFDNETCRLLIEKYPIVTFDKEKFKCKNFQNCLYKQNLILKSPKKEVIEQEFDIQTYARENLLLKNEIKEFDIALRICTVVNEEYRKILKEIKNRIPKDYEKYQWYEDVLNLIKKVQDNEVDNKRLSR